MKFIKDYPLACTLAGFIVGVATGCFICLFI